MFLFKLLNKKPLDTDECDDDYDDNDNNWFFNYFYANIINRTQLIDIYFTFFVF